MLFALLVAMLLARAVNAQPADATAPVGRPRICLVLSGGGARGAAHIGVLKALEALRVPIDCIAGASLGAAVGAAYATGVSTDEMVALAGELSTSELFKDRPPRRDLSIRRKLEDRTNLVSPEIGLQDGKLVLPKGIVAGVQMEQVLRTLVRTPGYRDFDALPIQYRAVATDLATGKPVVFSGGQLVHVVRASMSVPGIVAPLEYEGYLLVDGGLTDNLPVAAARAMGADIIIAVNLGTPLMRREQLSSVLDVAAQMLSILTTQNVRNSLALLGPADVLIEPELGDFSATDFDHLSRTIQYGEAAVRKQNEKLAQLGLAPDAYALLRRRQREVPAPDERPVDEIRLTALERVNPAFVTATMETKPGEPVQQTQLDEDMRRLFGTADFAQVNYRILEEPGKRILAVDAIEKSYGPDYLRFGLGLSTDFRGDSYFSVVASHRRTWINSLGAEWRTDIQGGQTTRITSEFYQPLNTRQSIFVAPRVELERRRVNVFQDTNRIASYNLRRFDLALDVGSQFTKYGEARLGVVVGRQNAFLSTGPAALSPGSENVRRGAIEGRFLVDQLDSASFPRSGYAAAMRIFASEPGLGADQAYVKADADGSYVWSQGRHSLNFAFKAGSNIGGNPLPRYDLFQWGGLLQQSGYSTGSLMGGNLEFARAVYYYKLARQSLLEGIYGGFSLEAGRMGAPLVQGSPTGLLKSGSLFVGLDTPVGPLYVAYGRAAAGHYAFYLYLGKP
jgi:NTE family protein